MSTTLYIKGNVAARSPWTLRSTAICTRWVPARTFAARRPIHKAPLVMPNPHTEILTAQTRSPLAIPRWEHLIQRHEVSLRGYGHTPDETFAQVALALMALIVEPGRVNPQGAIDLECRSTAPSLLLIDWLQLLKAEVLLRNRLFCAFDVHITGHHLQAMAWGESLDVARHSPAADLHAARIEAAQLVSRGAAAWTAECVMHL